MPLATDIILSDPVLQRIFFDVRLFAPRRRQVASVNNLLQNIADQSVWFLKAKRIALAEPEQLKMRRAWFAARDLSDGWFIELPAGHDDGCTHVMAFAHDNLDAAFCIDLRARAALWHRYARRSAPRIERHTDRL